MKISSIFEGRAYTGNFSMKSGLLINHSDDTQTDMFDAPEDEIQALPEPKYSNN